MSGILRENRTHTQLGTEDFAEVFLNDFPGVTEPELFQIFFFDFYSLGSRILLSAASSKIRTLLDILLVHVQ